MSLHLFTDPGAGALSEAAEVAPTTLRVTMARSRKRHLETGRRRQKDARGRIKAGKDKEAKGGRELRETGKQKVRGEWRQGEGGR